MTTRVNNIQLFDIDQNANLNVFFASNDEFERFRNTTKVLSINTYDTSTPLIIWYKN